MPQGERIAAHIAFLATGALLGWLPGMLAGYAAFYATGSVNAGNALFVLAWLLSPLAALLVGYICLDGLGDPRKLAKWTGIIFGIVLILPIAVIALVALAGRANEGQHKDEFGQPKRSFRPSGVPTSRTQAEWAAGFGRGTPHNLGGVYKADGQLRIDRGRDTYYLGDDEQWHLLGPGSPPYEAWRQGAIS